MRSFKSHSMLFGTLGATGLMATLGCGQAAAEAEKGLASSEAKQGYSLGHAIGTQFAEMPGDIDRAALELGFSDAINARTAAFGIDEMNQAIADFETALVEAAGEQTAALAAANAEAGGRYREQFAKEPGVVSLDNGLLYKVVEPGAGDPPAEGSSVSLHYRGSLVDGTEFDESYSRGEPISLTLEHAMPGWKAALERMPEGARWQVVIPPSLAYGETGAVGFVGPNTTLIFELERVAS
jgi:FKBP-type peptidyl-prolyl cis-trans isomerase FklB